MKKNTSKIERMLPFLVVFLLLSFSFRTFSTNARELVTLLVMAFAVVTTVIRIIRFYKEANPTINAIWIGSLLLMVTGGILYYLNIQLGIGIAVVGIVAFTYTWHYAFLENRPNLK